MYQVALYYPYVVPPTAWLKTSLLMCENVSSIVSPNIRPENPDIQWLESQEIWSPTFVNVGYADGYRDEIETVLLEFANRDSYRVGPARRVAPTELTPIYIGKLAGELELSMLDLGLAEVEPRSGNLLAHREVAAIVLAVTAKYVAMAHTDPHSRMVPSTDLPIFERVAYDPLRGARDRASCSELLLDGLVPVPGVGVSIPDIIDFRERHGDELGAFRVEIARMLRVIRSSEDPFDEVRSMREEIDQSVAQVKRAAASQRIRLVAGSCSVLVLGLIANTTMATETMHWMFDGFGALAVATLAPRMVRGRPQGDAFAYLLSAHKAFG